MSYTLYKDITTVNRTLMNNKENKYIVIHYTGNKTDTAKNNASYFKSTNRSASAHYFVDGKSVYQVVEDKDAAWAVGKNYGSNNLFNIVKNSNSISIEMCSDDGSIAYDTFNNTVELTKFIMKKYNIPASNVYRHFDVCSKQCPGWDGWIGNNEYLWNKFKSLISSTTTIHEPPFNYTVSELYRVRKSWSDVTSQIGAYSVFENAKAACKNGYSVFDSKGNVVYNISSNNSVNNNIPKNNMDTSFVVGETYTLQSEMKVRTGAGTNYKAKKYSELTVDGRKHDTDKDGALEKGTRVTCKEVKKNGNDTWIRTPSGWIAGVYNGKVYIK